MSKFGRIYASLATIVVIVLFSLLVFLRDLPSEALVAFIGVLVGSLISGFVQFAMSEASMRQQLRLAALDKRLQTAQEAYTLWRRLRRLPHPDNQTMALRLRILYAIAETGGRLIRCFLRQKREWPFGKPLMQPWSLRPLEVAIQIGRTSKWHTRILSKPVKS